MTPASADRGDGRRPAGEADESGEGGESRETGESGGGSGGSAERSGRPPLGALARRWRRPLAVAAPGLVPWTVVAYARGTDFVFAWALVNTNPLHLVDLWSYLFVYTLGFESLPPRLQAWPLATVLFAGAVGSAALSVVDREDPRLTAGLLALAALVHLRVTVGLARFGEFALPVGPVVLFGVAWWALGSR